MITYCTYLLSLSLSWFLVLVLCALTFNPPFVYSPAWPHVVQSPRAQSRAPVMRSFRYFATMCCKCNDWTGFLVVWRKGAVYCGPFYYLPYSRLCTCCFLSYLYNASVFSPTPLSTTDVIILASPFHITAPMDIPSRSSHETFREEKISICGPMGWIVEHWTVHPLHVYPLECAYR